MSRRVWLVSRSTLGIQDGIRRAIISFLTESGASRSLFIVHPRQSRTNSGSLATSKTEITDADTCYERRKHVADDRGAAQRSAKEMRLASFSSSVMYILDVAHRLMGGVRDEWKSKTRS